MQASSIYISGECKDMCPSHEIALREKERLLHILEIIPGTEKDHKPKADKKKMVKSFCRSGVGKTMQEPRNLRPPDVLLKTVHYLLEEVILNTKVPWTVTYDFIMDRLRSVRQDMIIQNVSIASSICILQPIVRFYAYASYRLCNAPLNNFDPFINKTHLQECLKRLLCMYDDCDIMFANTNICKDSYFTREMENCRPQFEALYLVLNLGSSTALTRALNLPTKWRYGTIKQAINLSLSYYRNNHARVCRIMRDLPALLLAVASLHLPEIRRNAFQVMSVAYHSKNLTFPINLLRYSLLYDKTEDVLNDCKHYGLEYTEDGVQFLKTRFDQNKLAVQPTLLKFINEKLAKIETNRLILNY